MPSLDLSPLFAELIFERILQSSFVLEVDQHSEDEFAIVRIHLKVLVGEGASNALEENESQLELSVIDGKSVALKNVEECVPYTIV